MKKILALTITLFLVFSLCSCDLLCGCEKDIDFPEDNFNIPEDNSLVTYKFSNGDILTLLYSNKDSVTQSIVTVTLIFSTASGNAKIKQ